MGKKIHLWSKTVSPQLLEKFCQAVVIKPSDYNPDLHAQVRELRDKQKKTYQEISTQLKIETKDIGYYLKTDPNKPWRLSDWIVGYHVKDSAVYEKIDFLVDNDPRLVEKFTRAGRKATLIEKV